MYFKRSRIFSLLLILLLPAISIGQPVWSLQRCIDYALENNLDIRQQMLNEQRVAADINQGYANLLPSLGAYSSQGFNYGRTVDRFTNEFATERVFGHNMYGSSDVILFAGFQNVNNIRYHLARQSALRYDTERLQNDIILAIAGAYLQILYQEDMLKVATEQLNVIEQQVERTRVLFNGGTVARGALLDMEAQAAQERLVLQQVENNLSLSYLELIHLLDLDPAEPFVVQRPELEVEGLLGIDHAQVVLERALSLEPSVLAAHERIQMAEKGLAINRGALAPRLSFSASVGTGYSEAAISVLDYVETGTRSQIGFTESNEAVYQPNYSPVIVKKPYRDQLSDNFNTQLMLNLQIPIFNRLQTRTRVTQSRIDLESARMQYDQVKNNLSKVIQQAHADATAAYQKYLSTQKSKDAFQESFHYVEQRFDVGLISTVEYNESKARLARAEAELLQAKYEFIFKSKILEFYQGKGLEL